MTLNDIGKALRKVLSAVARAAWGITLCAGGEILLGVLNFMFGILTALLSIVTIIWKFIWLLTL